MLLALLLACADGKEPVAAPTVSWLAPTDGSSLSAGDVSCSIIVEGFTLSSPLLHSAGTPEGYAEISVDEEIVLLAEDSTFTLALEAGERTLAAQLFYADGDEILALDGELCDAGEEEGCEPVSASIGVLVE